MRRREFLREKYFFLDIQVFKIMHENKSLYLQKEITYSNKRQLRQPDAKPELYKLVSLEICVFEIQHFGSYRDYNCCYDLMHGLRSNDVLKFFVIVNFQIA